MLRYKNGPDAVHPARFVSGTDILRPPLSCGYPAGQHRAQQVKIGRFYVPAQLILKDLLCRNCFASF